MYFLFLIVEYDELCWGKKLIVPQFLRPVIQANYYLCVIWGSGYIFKTLPSVLIGRGCG